MSIYDKSSLVLIPSGTKTGKVYSQKPVSGDGDFTFTRSSAATRVNADGNIEKETSNLLLQSNSFSTSPWNTNLVTATSGQSGYNGNNNAWKIDLTGAAGNLAVGGLSVGSVGTYSVYAKAGTLNWILLGSQSGNIQAYINLSDGSIGTTGALVIEAKTEDVGGGWYRCSMTYSGTASVVRVYPAQANGNLTATSGNIYIQDAQLEQGLVARDYIETTTSAVEGGITDNVPRLDYTDSSCPALLLEPLRTNKESNSELLGTYSNSIIRLVNDTTSPEGLVNANKIVEAAATARHEIYSDPISFNGNLHTISFFAKADERRYVSAFIGGDPAYGGVTFDLQTGTISQTSGGTTADVVDYGNNWYRCSFTTNYPSSSQVYLCMRTADNNVDVQTYAGDGTSGFYIWGLQVEAGSYATSYIPTYGSSVTRVVDSCLGAGNANTLNSTEGVLYTELSRFASSGVVDYCSIGISDGTNNNQVVFKFRNSINTFYTTIQSSNGNTRTDLSHTFSDLSETTKIAVKYKVNDFALWVNGVEVRTSNNANTPIGMDTFNFASATLSEPFYGNVNQILIFNTSLSDTELAALTTI